MNLAFQWKPELNLGIKQIDEQHQKLLSLGNEAYDLAKLNDGLDHYDDIMTLIHELYDYTEYHFKYEENLMKEYQYAAFPDHEKEHALFIKKITQISKKDIEDGQQTVIIEILDFISQWISSHILISDKKYVDILK